MKLPHLNPWLTLAVVGGIVYPPLIYFGTTILPPKVLVLIGLALIGFRFFSVWHKPDARTEKLIFFVAALGLIVLLFINARLAVQAYPVIVSLSVAAFFGASLFFPPTVVERIARLTEPDLSPRGVLYTRRVTMVWTVFLIANASVSAATSLWGTLAQWMLWNSLLSYLCMAALFAGEWIVRQRVRR